MHPFRFGLQFTRASSGARWLERARRAEALGYHVFSMPDHLGGQFSPLAGLAAAAAATERLRISVVVFANDYRHPLILSREAATLDVLSGGRLELGLGAGWMTSDYRQLGVTYDPPRVRIDRLSEAIPLVKRLLEGEVVTHRGPHYQLTAARAEPRTVQRPRPPLLIGGGGPRMLALAAREADIVGLLPQFDLHGRPMVRQGTESATAQKVAVVRAAAGDRFERLELNVFVGDAGLVGSGNRVGSSLIAAAKWLPVRLVGSPYVLYGTLASARNTLLRRRDALGISYYTLPGRAMEEMAPLVESLAGR